MSQTQAPKPPGEAMAEARARLLAARGKMPAPPSGSVRGGPGWSGGAKSAPGRNNSLQSHADAQRGQPDPNPAPPPSGAVPHHTKPSPTITAPQLNSLQAHANGLRTRAPYKAPELELVRVAKDASEERARVVHDALAVGVKAAEALKAAEEAAQRIHDAVRVVEEAAKPASEEPEQPDADAVVPLLAALDSLDEWLAARDLTLYVYPGRPGMYVVLYASDDPAVRATASGLTLQDALAHAMKQWDKAD